MPLKRYLNILIFLIFISITAVFAQGKVNVNFTGKIDPSISRFVGFSAIVPADEMKKVDRRSFKIFINGKDDTVHLRSRLDTKTGDLILEYKPATALPLGKIEEKLTAEAKGGNMWVEKWTIDINPAFDKELAPWINSITNDPKNFNAHYQLAKIYEAKYLLEDAAYEYKKVVYLSPNHGDSKKALARIFALWDKKKLTKNKVTVDISLDNSLADMGKLLLFEISITPYSSSALSFDPKDVSIIVDGELQEKRIQKLNDYPMQAYNEGRISLDDYAKFTYFLDSHNISLFEETNISPRVTKSGYIAFAPYSVIYEKLYIIIPLKTADGEKIIFKFPFVSH